MWFKYLSVRQNFAEMNTSKSIRKLNHKIFNNSAFIKFLKILAKKQENQFNHNFRIFRKICKKKVINKKEITEKKKSFEIF